MVHALHPLQQTPQLGAVIHIAARKQHLRCQPVAIARREVIKRAHLVPVMRQLVGKRAAQKSGTAGNKKFQSS